MEEVLGWDSSASMRDPEIPNLFPQPDGEGKILYDLIAYHQLISIDDLIVKSGLAAPKVMQLLTEMEFDGMVVRKPGNRFALY